MAFPLFKFTLSNTIEGTLEIKEPEGWDDGILKLERNKEYHSLVEYWDQPLLFDDAEASDLLTQAILPGGLEWIKNIEYTQGVGAIIGIEIEISEDEGSTYETIFLGTIALDTVKEVDFYKAEYGVLRDDFWAKLINRKSTPVDLQATVDLDGNARTPVSNITLNMPSQLIREKFVRNTDYNNDNEGLFTSYTAAVDTETYLIFDTSRSNLDEIEDRFEYGTQISDEIPTGSEKYLFRAKFGGSYRIEADIKFAVFFNTSVNVDVRWFYAIRQSGTLTTTQIGSTSSAAGVIEVYDNGTESLDVTVQLQPGDEIYVFGRMNLNVSATATYFPDYDTDSGGPFVPVYTSLTITADTFYKETTTDAYLIDDAFESVVSKITGFDSTVTFDYACALQYAIMKGQNLRGFSFVDRKFAQSLDDLWEGFDPILNLGLGYLYGQNKIEILQKAAFYNKTTLLNLDFVNNIERSYELEHLFKSIKIGYQKPSDTVNPDDPQTRRTYSTSLPVGGKADERYSKYIAASVPIEETRREDIKEGKDWKYDEDTFVINVHDVSGYRPKFSEDFNLITGLLNPDYRVNILITAARNMQRWLNYYSGGLQIPTAQEITFRDGTGNYQMTSQLNPDACEASDLTPEPVLEEDGNFEVSEDFLFMPILYTFEHPMTFSEYKLIRDNRKNAIGVSRGDTDHKPCFIMNCEYKPTHAIATFEVLLGVNEPL